MCVVLVSSLRSKTLEQSRLSLLSLASCSLCFVCHSCYCCRCFGRVHSNKSVFSCLCVYFLPRQMSPDCFLNLYIHDARNLVGGTLDLVKEHFNLKSTVITNIPMRVSDFFSDKATDRQCMQHIVGVQRTLCLLNGTCVCMILVSAGEFCLCAKKCHMFCELALSRSLYYFLLLLVLWSSLIKTHCRKSKVEEGPSITMLS